MATDIVVKPTTKAAKQVAKAGSLPSRGRAYVTFLAGDGDYVKGVVGLAKGLRKARSAYPLVVAVLRNVPKEHRSLLINQGCMVCQIEQVFPPENYQADFALDYYVINYSKLRIWEFVDYSKMVYLDADVLVFDNIDHLFDLPDGHFYAGVDCFCELYSQRCAEKVQRPQVLGPEPPYYFNAGVFVFEPSFSTYADLMKTLQVTPPTAYAEQDFLNMFFKDVYKPIPPVYNFLVAMLWRHPEEIELDKVKVVHYCALGSKPWRYTGKEENMEREDMKMLVKKWWNIYDYENLDYELDANVAAEDDEAQNVQFMTAPWGASVTHHIGALSAAYFMDLVWIDFEFGIFLLSSLVVVGLWMLEHPFFH